MKTKVLIAAAVAGLLAAPMAKAETVKIGINWAASTGGLPADAFIGGSENNGSRKLAVCRAAYQGGTHPGKVVAGKCNIGWGGKEIVLNAFEVLVPRSLSNASSRQNSNPASPK